MTSREGMPTDNGILNRPWEMYKKMPNEETLLELDGRTHTHKKLTLLQLRVRGA